MGSLPKVPWVPVSFDEIHATFRALMEVQQERVGQLDEFPLAEDDALEPAEWIARVVKHTGRAVSLTPADFRREMVVVAAICVAAVEAYDRRYGDG